MRRSRHVGVIEPGADFPFVHPTIKESIMWFRAITRILPLVLILSSCGENGEETSEELEEAGESVGAAVENAAEDIGEAADEAGEEIQEAASEVADEVRGDDRDSVTIRTDTLAR